MLPLDELKLIIREDDIPFFMDEQLAYHLEKVGGNIEAAAYNCLLIKAEDSTLSVSGLNTSDTSKYFRRLASQHRPSNSGVLKGAF